MNDLVQIGGAAQTKIGWTHRPRADGTLMPGFTFNPWWGCEKVSPACKHCYADTFARRTGRELWGATAPRMMMSEKRWNDPRRWNAAAAAAGEQWLVFCASMADVLEDRPDLVAPRARLCRLVEATPSLIWLFLTKRPENHNLLPPRWLRDGRENVWFGATAENQQLLDERAPSVASARWAAFRFLSVEPMMGRIDASAWLGWGDHNERLALGPCPHGRAPWNRCDDEACQTEMGSGIDWIIIGGGTGGAHDPPLDIAAAGELARQAIGAGAAVFVKQDSHPRVTGLQGRLPDDLWALKQFPRAA